jgi:hypothetical protein
MPDVLPEDENWEVDEPEPIVAFYSQDKTCRTNMPFSCDCSGLVWWSYNQMGLAEVMFPSSDAGVREQVEWFEATQWRAADLIMRWNQKDPSGPANTRMARLTLNERDPEDPTKDFLHEGDLLYRCDSPTAESDHVSFFIRWDHDAVGVYDAHPLMTPAVGYRTINYDVFVDSYTHVLRPKPVGYLMSYRYSASIPKVRPEGSVT